MRHFKANIIRVDRKNLLKYCLSHGFCQIDCALLLCVPFFVKDTRPISTSYLDLAIFIHFWLPIPIEMTDVSMVLTNRFADTIHPSIDMM